MTATTTDPDVDVEPEVEPDPEPRPHEWDFTSITIPQTSIVSDETVEVPEYDLNQPVFWVGQGRVKSNKDELNADEKVDHRARVAVKAVSLVDGQDVEDFLAGERQRRTGQLEMLSTVGELRRAGRTFADRAEHHRAEGRTREQVDGWGVRTVLGRAMGHLDIVREMQTDDGETHPLHWSDPASIDEDVIDIVEREIDEAGAYLCAARDWAVRHRGRLNEARAEAKKVAAQDGVVLTEAEANDLRERDAMERNGSYGGPRDPDGQTKAVLGVLESSEIPLTTKAIALEAHIPQTGARNVLKELAPKGTVVKTKDGRTDLWALADGSGSATRDDAHETGNAQFSDETERHLSVVDDEDVVPTLDELDDGSDE